jgi:hypothetical protein
MAAESIAIIIQNEGPGPQRQTQAQLVGGTVTTDASGQKIVTVGGAPGPGNSYYAGTVVLTNGESTEPISVPKLDANSRVFFTQGPLNASTALGVARQANHQTPGTPGTIDLVASYNASGVVETGDQSTLYWQVIELTQ